MMKNLIRGLVESGLVSNLVWDFRKLQKSVLEINCFRFYKSSGVYRSKQWPQILNFVLLRRVFKEWRLQNFCDKDAKNYSSLFQSDDNSTQRHWIDIPTLCNSDVCFQNKNTCQIIIVEGGFNNVHPIRFGSNRSTRIHVLSYLWCIKLQFTPKKGGISNPISKKGKLQVYLKKRGK